VIAFLDSSALIYYFEGNARYRKAVFDTLQAVKASDPNAQVAVSRLGVMECRVKPLREGDRALLARYDTFFAQVQIVELSATVVDHATHVRATTALKTPNCLQAACAFSLGDACRFITGDEDFARVQGLKVHQVKLDSD
jgi:predicted nucleic acid-binding protein